MTRRVTASARAGFTLAELLATMTLLGILGTIVANLMLGQQRFYHRLNEQTGMRRELRTALGLVPSDLRGVSSSGGDLLAFNATSVTFRNTLGTSIVCGKPDNGTLDLPPLNTARHTLTSWYTQPQVGDSIFAFNEGVLRGAEDDSWTAMRITSIAQNAALCPASPYTDAVLDAEKQRWRVTVSPVIPDSVKVGAGVRFVRSTRYTLTPSATSRYYLSRAEYLAGAWTAGIPVSGPYETPVGVAGGVRFRFFDSTGVEINNVANAVDVSRIDVLLRTQGATTSGSGGSPALTKDSLRLRIALRNRQ
jgi:prepilin-type N-terminal cleavage/methylation domain-containing protein